MNDMDFSTSVEIDALEVKIEHLVGIGQRNNRLHAHSKHKYKNAIIQSNRRKRQAQLGERLEIVDKSLLDCVRLAITAFTGDAHDLLAELTVINENMKKITNEAQKTAQGTVSVDEDGSPLGTPTKPTGHSPATLHSPSFPRSEASKPSPSPNSHTALSPLKSRTLKGVILKVNTALANGTEEALHGAVSPVSNNSPRNTLPSSTASPRRISRLGSIGEGGRDKSEYDPTTDIGQPVESPRPKVESPRSMALSSQLPNGTYAHSKHKARTINQYYTVTGGLNIVNRNTYTCNNMDAFLDDSKDTFANSRILFDQELSASSTPYLSVSEMQIKKHREKIDHVETFMECVQSPKLSCGSSCCKQEEVRAANLVGSIADVTNKLDRKYHSLIDSRNNHLTQVCGKVNDLVNVWGNSMKAECNMEKKMDQTLDLNEFDRAIELHKRLLRFGETEQGMSPLISSCADEGTFITSQSSVADTSTCTCNGSLSSKLGWGSTESVSARIAKDKKLKKGIESERFYMLSVTFHKWLLPVMADAIMLHNLLEAKDMNHLGNKIEEKIAKVIVSPVNVIQNARSHLLYSHGVIRLVHSIVKCLYYLCSPKTSGKASAFRVDDFFMPSVFFDLLEYTIYPFQHADDQVSNFIMRLGSKFKVSSSKYYSYLIQRGMPVSDLLHLSFMKR